jgi:RNA polymerase sigma-32 factor
MTARQEFDYIIVGAGSAGCVLAARLSQDPGVRVALVEAGGRDDAPEIAMPVAFPQLRPGVTGMTNRSGQRLLEADQEQQLARRWRELGDRKVADELVTSHLRLAAKVARRYTGYGLPLADLVAEANLGLVIAAARFEPDRGARFSTYALCWMKATILDYVPRSSSLVKIGTTAAQKKLFFGLRREMNKLGRMPAQLNPEAVKTIASRLGVASREVIEMDCRLRGDASLNRPINDEGQAVEREAMLVDPAPDAEAILAEHEEDLLQKKAPECLASHRHAHIVVPR